MNGIFEIQQFLNLSWRDPRIQFHNLKNRDYQNFLLESEKQTIWIPTVTFLNTADQVHMIFIKFYKVLYRRHIAGAKSAGQQVPGDSGETRHLPGE